MADRGGRPPYMSHATNPKLLQEKLRPGAILAVAVVAVVGLAGIVQWNQRLILTALVAGVAVFVLNAVVVAIRFWHGRNTKPEATYLDAEQLVRLRRPKSR